MTTNSNSNSNSNSDSDILPISRLTQYSSMAGFGYQLYLHRQARGLDYREAAKEIGIAHTTLHAIENSTESARSTKQQLPPHPDQLFDPRWSTIQKCLRWLDNTPPTKKKEA